MTMVVVSGAPAAIAVPGNTTVVETFDSTIARYLDSGERVRGLMDVSWRVCLALAVIVVLAWMLGALPGAVRLL
jgi:hypothetical protein